MPDARIDLLQWVDNAVYGVRPNGAAVAYVLKVYDTRFDAASVGSELSWLERLQGTPGLELPRPWRSSAGELTTELTDGRSGQRRVCGMVSWLRGRRPGRSVSRSRMRLAGAAIARLHRATRRLGTGPGWRRPRLDAEGLLGDEQHTGGWRRLSREQASLFRRVARQLDRTQQELGTGPDVFGPIHGDLSLGNLLFRGQRVGLIDFADCCHGWFLYDLATLVEMLEPSHDYRGLRAAVLAGYGDEPSSESRLETLLDVFIAARWVFLTLSLLAREDHPVFKLAGPRILAIVERKLPGLMQGWD